MSVIELSWTDKKKDIKEVAPQPSKKKTEIVFPSRPTFFIFIFTLLITHIFLDALFVSSATCSPIEGLLEP